MFSRLCATDPLVQSAKQVLSWRNSRGGLMGAPSVASGRVMRRGYARRRLVAEPRREEFLKLNSVKPGARILYHNAVAELESWAAVSQHPLGSPSQVDLAMENFFTRKFFDGHGPAIGRNVL